MTLSSRPIGRRPFLIQTLRASVWAWVGAKSVKTVDVRPVFRV